MVATVKDIRTMLERGEQPQAEPMEILTKEENAEADRQMQELLGDPSTKENNDGSNPS